MASNTQLAALVENWIEMNHPGHARALRSARARAPMLRGVGDAGGTFGSAVMTGPGTNAVKQDSKVLDSLIGKDDEEAIKKFKDSAALGATSVMDMAREASGYNPLVIPDIGDINGRVAMRQAYHDYLRRLADCPLVHIELSDTKQTREQATNFDVLIDKIASTFEGIKSEDQSAIKKSLTDLCKAALSWHQKQQTMDLFVQNVVDVTTGTDRKITLYIYSSTVSLMSDVSKGVTTTQDDFIVQRGKCSFRADMWPSWAERVYKVHVATLDTWLANNNTPKGNKTNIDKTCLPK